MIRSFASVALALSACIAFAAQKPIPNLSSPVIDEVGILNPAERTQLDEFIRARKDVAQMQVWITTLDGESVEGLSYRAASQWKLGTEKGDNGILMLVAPAERRMRIEVGRGLEGDIPDILAGRILDYTARPLFREGKYFEGIRTSLEQVHELAAKGPAAQKLRDDLTKGPSRPSWPILVFFGVLICALMLVFWFFRTLSRSSRSTGWTSQGATFWAGSGSSSYSSDSSFSSGSSWSGGGGSFGGGGSSSSW